MQPSSNANNMIIKIPSIAFVWKYLTQIEYNTVFYIDSSVVFACIN